MLRSNPISNNEVLAVVAVFYGETRHYACREGLYTFPTAANTNVAVFVMEPENDVVPYIKARQGLRKVKWVVGLYKSDKNSAMILL